MTTTSATIIINYTTLAIINLFKRARLSNFCVFSPTHPFHDLLIWMIWYTKLHFKFQFPIFWHKIRKFERSFVWEAWLIHFTIDHRNLVLMRAFWPINFLSTTANSTHHGCDKLVKKLIWNVIAIGDIYLKYTCTILPMVLIQLQMTLFSNEKYDIRTICPFHMLK